MASSRTPTAGEFEQFGIVWNSYTTPELLHRCRSFEFKPSDICVCTFPRCGTTVTQEIVWHIVNRRTAVKGEHYPPIDERFPFLEFNYRWGSSELVEFGIDRLIAAGNANQQRLIKTHCPLSVIGQSFEAAKPRTVCTIRNPKDCCHSLYRFYKGHEMYGPWPGSWEEFVDIFLAGKTMCGDYFQVTAEWWQMRDKANVLLVKYEDIVRKPEETINKIASFLGAELTEAQKDCVLHNCKFDSMYDNNKVNKEFSTGFRFLRKGVIGDWKEAFTESQSERIDQAVQQRFHPIGLTFDYE